MLFMDLSLIFKPMNYFNFYLKSIAMFLSFNLIKVCYQLENYFFLILLIICLIMNYFIK